MHLAGHWANWMFEVDEYDAKTKTLGWTKGGFQCARGNNNGAEWFIENVFELLDAPNEFCATEPPPASLQFEVPTLQTLKKVVGTMDAPVRNVSLKGLTYRDSAYTYMEPHGVPSGGDWALQRMGAVFVEGAEGVA
eukprot:gene1748-501_t